MFQECGYEATTMRAIADRAGVSLGSSYHYFPSKEHFVLEFYRHTHELHLGVIAQLLSRERDLGARLRCQDPGGRGGGAPAAPVAVPDGDPLLLDLRSLAWPAAHA